MPYVLGIDVGTSRTAAAVCRQTGSTWADAEIVQLGTHAPEVPTVLYFAADGGILVGDTAQQHAITDPANAARGFARRVGDDVPVMVGRETCAAEELTAVLVAWVVNTVNAAEGAAPQHIVLTHPAGWGGYRRRMLLRALRQANLDNVTLLPEPVAVGESHAAGHDVVAGQALAVYDLGAGSLSSAVVRRSPAGTFELLTSAESVEPNGGDSFDDIVFEHIRAVVEVDMTDPHVWTTLTRLRQMCTQAKEFLSTGGETSVREIRVTRTEFEDLIRPAVEAGIEELLRTIRSAPVPAEDLASVVITGGSASIPLVSELLTAQLRNRTVLAPDFTCARGAAIAARSLVPARRTEVVPVPAPATEPPPPDRPDVDLTPLDLPATRSFMRMIGVNRGVAGAAAGVVLAAGVALTFYLRPDAPSQPAPVHAVVASTSSTSTQTQQTGEGGR
ncbi:Hsp70 family protein [Actinocrispum wychmicini]|uniref:Hsp70 protein n=1 Tax=Actinocrispum wychmicini TaxID=1213861 RepID=A0A4R2IRU0_9PSEU|nr:Hsp70 family protein [Actinocrispum wychmicini]TCO48013.1 Hsp70 protein [Actinocrispum wychmicini]